VNEKEEGEWARGLKSTRALSSLEDGDGHGEGDGDGDGIGSSSSTIGGNSASWDGANGID